MAPSPEELRAQLQGLLSFPVTPFTNNGELDLQRFGEHLQYLISSKPYGLFVCGGTGEFFL
jgi:5-dehydro-4-deoxyglucarate dehydratase